MSNFKIERGIPIPAGKKDFIWGSLFGQMKVGDSVLLTKTEKHGFYQWMSKNYPKRIVFRKINDNSYRAWKVEEEEK